MRQQRVTETERIKSTLQLSERHRKWGYDCPAVDIDFLLLEYDQGNPVAVIDYKQEHESKTHTHSSSYQALSSLHHSDGQQIPFFIIRWVPDPWQFHIQPINTAAKDTLPPTTTITEQELYKFLTYLRKGTYELTAGEERYMARLDNHWTCVLHR